MNNEIIHTGQSFLDKVSECTGSLDNAFAIAILNKASITDSLITGNYLNFEKVTNIAVAEFFNTRKPATDVSLNIELTPELGIGEMIIELNFKVA